MRINTNLTAMNTYTQYTKNQNKISSAVAKLSSGYAINTAADNAAGLAISEKMRAQIRGLDKASANSQDAISLVQTAEGALDSSTEILQRMRELAVQSSSDTNQDEIDRSALQDEFSQLQGELNDIAKNTTFNKKNLLDGSLSSTKATVSNANLANTSMTVDLGKAAAGSYGFSVTTKQETAAIDGQAPTNNDITLVDDANTFNNTSIAVGGGIPTSAQLNGNYSLTATWDTDKQQMTVTATGDNNQTLTANISKTDLAALASAGGDVTMDFGSNAFSLTFDLATNMTASDSNYTTLAGKISNMTISVAGGVDAQAATYGIYANMTGASSVKLESGMDSVTFDNGVTVNFDKLSSSAVSTTGTLSTKAAGTFGTGVNGASVKGSSATLADGKYDFSATSLYSITSESTNSITGSTAATNYTIGSISNVTGTVSTNGAAAAFDVTGANVKVTLGGVTYTSTQTKATALPTTGGTITFSDGNGNSFDLALTNSSGSASDLGTALTGGSLKLASDKSQVDVTMSNAVTGDTYKATLADANTTASNGDTITLNFTGTGATEGTAKINLTANAAIASAVDMATALTTTAGNGVTLNNTYNYEAVFADATGSTNSTFDVATSKGEGLTIQVGANEGDTMKINIDKMDAGYLGVASASVATQSAAASAIGVVDNAINEVSSQRATLGAIQNRLDYKIDNLNTSSTNLTSAESQIRDVDMAKEMTEFTNANILSQASTAMLAQANSLPQSVLSLIGK